MTSPGLLILTFGFFLIILAGIPEVSRRTRGLFYGWWLIGIGALVMALSIAPFFHAMTA